ncbi:outer membrane protein assembly factor BamB family protein [Phytohabitans sp. LJ34]|uniref:outer membrane protein assembly factor BamB family protein n=1 Tax=Phytohabitans sp. LJ34 TaxID=3452217 RepID=UPI003F8A898B
MSSDLDRMFGALRHDADAIPLGRASTARRRGERRRRTRLIAATAAVACVVGAGLTGGGWLARNDAAPQPAGPPRPLTDMIPLEGGAESFTPSATSGDRVLVAWRTQGRLAVRLADLETGQPIGPTRELGSTLNYPDVVGLPWAFVAIGDGEGGRAYVLDPESGDVRWSLPSGDLLYYPFALVAVAGGVTRGFDWDTGAQLWQAPAPADAPVRSLGVFTPADPLPRASSIEADAFGYARPLAGDRLLQITAGGALLVRDARTGRQLSRRPGVAPADEAYYMAYDGRLYAWPRDGTFRLTVTDVDGAAAPRQLYRAAAGRFGEHVVPCGTGQVCFIEGNSTATQVVAVEVSSGRVAWRAQATRKAPSLLPVGDRLLVSADDGSSSALLDRDGRQLLGPDERGVPLVWLTTGTLLTMGQADLVEISAADGTRRFLATSPEGRWRCSSWNERRLVCHAGSGPSAAATPADGGFQVWSIAR